MKKGRVSLAIAIVTLIIGIAVLVLGTLNGLGVLDTRFATIFSLATIYTGLIPNSYGVAQFGALLLLISIIVFSFRGRKPYSMFLPFFLIGIYATVGIFLRLCYGNFVPEVLFTTLRNESRSMPLMFLLILVEVALTAVLLVATSKLDSRWYKKKQLVRKKLENDGVLVSKEDVLVQKEKARIAKDSAENDKKQAKIQKKLEKERAKEERKENKKDAKDQLKKDKEYEKTREELERKKEAKEDKESERLRKEAEKKAYQESIERDKAQALSKKEEKKRLKEQKKLDKEKKRQGEPVESNYEIPQGPANPNKPLEFPTLPDDVPELPEIVSNGYQSKEEKAEDRPEIAYVEESRHIAIENDYKVPVERPRFDLKTKHYKAGGMVEATLEMMNNAEVQKNQQKLSMGFEDIEEDESERISVSSDNKIHSDPIAPSNLSPEHPRYKMFESLKQAPQTPVVKEDVKAKQEEKAKIAPSGLSPEHPRYRMFESLQSNGANSVSHFPSRAFQPEEESVPTTGTKTVTVEKFKPKPIEMSTFESSVAAKSEKSFVETPMAREDVKTSMYNRFDNGNNADKQNNANYDSLDSSKSSMPKSDKIKLEEKIEPHIEPEVNDTANSDIPEQTESLDLSVGIGGLVSNNAGYGAIMKRGRKLYTAPPVTLLKDYPGLSSELDPHTMRQGEVIVETYAQQKINVVLADIIKGPTVTMYVLTLEAGTIISRIRAREDELNYALGGKHVRILAPISGKQAVGIEVPNEKTSVVGFKDMIYALRANEKYLSLRVPMILGKTITGEPIVIDVAKMPHMIIAGTTGSGKSVCINAFINTLIYQKSPADVRLVLVDPKVVELSLYNGIPHLLTPVITEAKKVVKMLNFLVEEMERRYTMLSNYGVRNIEGYNQKLRDEKIAAEKMPYIVLIMDEFADMMSVVGKDIEIQISRLAAKARAAGIHLILATQRPSSDVITGTIKSNLPARIAFSVSSGLNSRVILDEGGAENLLGKGDMLLLDPSVSELNRIQGAFLSDGEVEAVVNFAKVNGGEPDYLDDAIFEDNDDRRSDDDFGDGPIGDEDSDEVLFEQAKQIVYEKKSASASYLQRRMKIGYNRAARLIEMMEEKGIVGPKNGSKPREIHKFE